MSKESNDLKVGLIKPLIFEEDEETKNVNEEQELIKPLIFEQEKDPEEKIYLLLYYFTNKEDEEDKSFEFFKGRSVIRENIISMLASGDIDIHKSKVLVEGVPLEDAITMYSFMKLIEAHFPDDPFDIENYNYLSDEEDEESDIPINMNTEIEDKEIEVIDNQKQMLGLYDEKIDEDQFNV